MQILTFIAIAVVSVLVAVTLHVLFPSLRAPSVVSPELRRGARLGRREMRPGGRAIVVVMSNDRDFVEAIREGVASHGALVEQLTDITRIAALEELAPDAFVVDIERLAPNGFLFGRALKKNRTLDDAMLVIVSSDPNAIPIFEQHKKLRSRADVYVEAKEGIPRIVDALVAQTPLTRAEP